MRETKKLSNSNKVLNLVVKEISQHPYNTSEKKRVRKILFIVFDQLIS